MFMWHGMVHTRRENWNIRMESPEWHVTLLSILLERLPTVHMWAAHKWQQAPQYQCCWGLQQYSAHTSDIALATPLQQYNLTVGASRSWTSLCIWRFLILHSIWPNWRYVLCNCTTSLKAFIGCLKVPSCFTGCLHVPNFRCWKVSNFTGCLKVPKFIGHLNASPLAIFGLEGPLGHYGYEGVRRSHVSFRVWKSLSSLDV